MMENIDNDLQSEKFIWQHVERMREMYFVDREKIEETLLFLEKQISIFANHSSWGSPIEQAALERLTHTMIESILDVGNAMIDGFIMRDPGSYEDIVDILDDEKVITKDMGESFKQVVNFRKKLVQEYISINHQEVYSFFAEKLPQIERFPNMVRSYLENELGPVTAFKN